MRLSLLLLPLLMSVAFLSCGKRDGCDAGTICTEDFRAVSVRLVNAGGTAPTLDSVQTIDERGAPLRSNTKQRVYGLTGTASGGSMYANVVDDGWVEGNRNSEIQVTLRGFRAGTVVFEEAYTIGADCCHVYKTSGSDLITVTN